MTAIEEMERRGEVIRAVIRGKIRDPDLADDLSQEVLLKCWLRYCAKGEVPPEGYAVRMAQNEVRSWGRKHGCRCQPESFKGDRQDTKQADPATTAEAREQSQTLALALEALPALYRESVRLSLIDGHSIREISEQKKVPLDTVKTQVRRARGILRDQLKGYILE
jgi:RNA polymerase sigma-70 factor, ECF subfamily